MSRRSPCGERGQAVMVDLAFAFFLFMLLFLAAATAWNSTVETWSGEQRYFENVFLAQNALDALVRTPGWPVDWESGAVSDANFLGLARSPRVMDADKVGALFGPPPADPAVLSQKMRLGNRGFYLRLYGGAVDKNAGSLPTDQNGDVLVFRQNVLYMDESAFLELWVYGG